MASKRQKLLDDPSRRMDLRSWTERSGYPEHVAIVPLNHLADKISLSVYYHSFAQTQLLRDLPWLERAKWEVYWNQAKSIPPVIQATRKWILRALYDNEISAQFVVKKYTKSWNVHPFGGSDIKGAFLVKAEVRVEGQWPRPIFDCYCTLTAMDYFRLLFNYSNVYDSPVSLHSVEHVEWYNGDDINGEVVKEFLRCSDPG